MTKLLIFSITVMLVIILLLCYCNKKIKSGIVKDRILKIVALITVFFHYSSLWVDYFSEGFVEVENTMLLPIYPCNICMWLLLIVAFVKNKKSFFCQSLIEFLAIGGSICGLIGLFANEIFLNDPNFFDYDSLKGLLSHSTMIFGTLFLLTQGYVKIRTISITRSTIIGLAIFAVDGAIINLLFALFKLPEVNSMYMLEFPIDLPGFNFMTMGLAAVLVVFALCNLYELIFLKAHQRWYYKKTNDKIKVEE